jgi:hypothetical protein
VRGVLSTLTQQNLYRICLKNGLKQSWPMFSGKRANLWNFQITVQANNTMPDQTDIYRSDGYCCNVSG